jgi:SAM-dependent methyltransferase
MRDGSVKVGRRLAHAREQSGLPGVSAEVLRLARRSVVLPVVAVIDALFDRRMGVRTHGETHHETAIASLSLGGDPYNYQPVHLLFWRRLHSTIPLNRHTATYVDLGAGRGRAVILAAEMGFRRVVGVELDEQLVAEAQENIHRWRSRRRRAQQQQQVTVVHGDAAAYRLPDGPLVILLYNPFGPTTMRYVLRQICERTRRSADPVYIAYLNPVNQSVFREFPQLVVHSRARRWAVYRLDPTQLDLADTPEI